MASADHDFVRARVNAERDTVKMNLRGELQNLRLRVEHAIEAFEADDRLDEHLITNASGITAYIARWNLVRDLLPLVAEPVVDSKPIVREPGKPDRRKK